MARPVCVVSESGAKTSALSNASRAPWKSLVWRSKTPKRVCTSTRVGSRAAARTKYSADFVRSLRLSASSAFRIAFRNPARGGSLNSSIETASLRFPAVRRFGKRSVNGSAVITILSRWIARPPALSTTISIQPDDAHPFADASNLPSEETVARAAPPAPASGRISTSKSPKARGLSLTTRPRSMAADTD